MIQHLKMNEAGKIRMNIYFNADNEGFVILWGFHDFMLTCVPAKLNSLWLKSK